MNINLKKNSTTRYFSFLSCAIALGVPAIAQAAEEPVRGQGVLISNSKEFKPLGLHAGSFYFYPAIEIGVKQDSNVYRLPKELERSDTIGTSKLSAAMESDWNRHELNARVSANLGYYDKYTDEDYQDYVATAEGRLDVVKNSFATGRVGYKKLHEDRRSLDDRGSTKPTKFDRAYVGVGYDHKPNRLRTLVKLDYESLDYKNGTSVLGGAIDNDDRDRTRPEATIRLGYENLPGKSLFIQGEFYAVDYDKKLDNNGLERSSTGYKVKAGLNFDLTSLLIGDVFVGYLGQNYDESSFTDIKDPLFGFGLSWYPTGLTTIYLDLDRFPSETTDPNAAGYLSTVFSVQADHELLRNLFLTGALKYKDNKYQQLVPGVPGGKENEDIFGADLGMKYLFNRRFYATAEYKYERRNSDLERQEYKLNRGFLSLGANW